MFPSTLANLPSLLTTLCQANHVRVEIPLTRAVNRARDCLKTILNVKVITQQITSHKYLPILDEIVRGMESPNKERFTLQNGTSRPESGLVRPQKPKKEEVKLAF